MKFDVKQQFDADAAAVIGCYSSAEMYEQLPEFGKISRPDLLDRAEHGDTVKIRLRYKFTADLPTAALAIIDPDVTWVVRGDAMASKSRNTPFEGRTLRGRVRHTVLHGEPVVVDGEAQR